MREKVKIIFYAAFVVLLIFSTADSLLLAEYLSSDINQNGIVDQEDLKLLAVQWLNTDCQTPGWCSGVDLDQNGRVDKGDFRVLANHWLVETADDAFVTIWNTNLGTAATVTLALGGTVNAEIDWGDGTIWNETTAGPKVYNYGAEGIYTVRVTGTVTEYNALVNGGSDSERAKLTAVQSWGQLGWQRLDFAFFEASNLVSVPNNSIGIEGVTGMNQMFYLASSFNQDLNNWDTSNVREMDVMFYNAQSFNGDISNWNTSSVITMSGMFNGASVFNRDIGAWDTSNVSSMSYMFKGAAAFNADISGWNTSSVWFMGDMFNNASAFNQDLSGWCVEKISSEPSGFDRYASSWVLPRPAWGTCP